MGQRYPGLEYVVQDGGSTDGSLDVLRRFDPLLTRWVSERDDGQADAINRGFRDTTGSVMAWINSDDRLLPGSLSYVALFFHEHPKVDVIYGHRLIIDENDRLIGSWTLPRHDDRVLTLVDYVPQETLFWRRRVWEAVGAHVDPSFRFALDWDLLLRFREAGATMVRVPRYLGAFRVHDEQKTNALEAVGLEECARLRTRVHGRDPPRDDVARRLAPYLLRHLVVHAGHRLVDRVSRSRVPVSILPSESSLAVTVATPSSPGVLSRVPQRGT